MSKNAYNEIFKKQTSTLITSTFKKAVVSAVQAQNNTADVYFVDSPNTVIRSIPLASHIDATKVMVGDKCRVDLFDEKNSRDMVIAYCYGRKF